MAESGILTQKQREYLKGDREYDEDAERMARKRIRDRLYNSFRDLTVLYDEYDAEELEKALTSPNGEDVESVPIHKAIAFLMASWDMCVWKQDKVAHTYSEKLPVLLENCIESQYDFHDQQVADVEVEVDITASDKDDMSNLSTSEIIGLLAQERVENQTAVDELVRRDAIDFEDEQSN